MPRGTPFMTAPSAKEHPRLKAAWDAYGHAFAWDQLIACRFSFSSENGYCLLAWREPDGMMNYADLAWDGREWQMQNDGHEPISEANWKKIKMVKYCDWHERPEGA